MKKINIIYLSLFAISVLFSCSEPCSQSIESAVNIKFYAAKDSKYMNPLKFSLTATGINRPDTFPDSSVYKQYKNVSIKLPLAPSANSCGFVLFFDSIPEIIIHKDTFYFYNSFKDTIFFQYTGKPKLLSPDCGFIMEFKIENVSHTHHGIDSIFLIQPDINTSNEENLKIFL